MTPPADPRDASQCPVLNPGAVAAVVVAKLGERAIPAGGPGLGPCGDSASDYAGWNMSVSVTSWAQAEVAVRVLGEALATYDVAGYIGVSVQGIPCAEPL